MCDLRTFGNLGSCGDVLRPAAEKHTQTKSNVRTNFLEKDKEKLTISSTATISW